MSSLPSSGSPVLSESRDSCNRVSLNAICCFPSLRNTTLSETYRLSSRSPKASHLRSIESTFWENICSACSISRCDFCIDPSVQKVRPTHKPPTAIATMVAILWAIDASLPTRSKSNRDNCDVELSIDTLVSPRLSCRSPAQTTLARSQRLHRDAAHGLRGRQSGPAACPPRRTTSDLGSAPSQLRSRQSDSA